MCISNNTKKHLCCADCFSVESIRAFINAHGVKDNCHFCNSKNVMCAEARDVGSFIMICVEKKYEDAANSVFYESAEGGYDITTDTIEEVLIDNEDIFTDRILDPIELVDTLIGLDGTPYVRRDPYGPRLGGRDVIETWEDFKKSVKGDRRYTALHKYIDEMENDRHPATFFNELVDLLATSLSTELEPGTKIYRSRKIESGVNYGHKDLTSPPREKSIHNRMSPKGVSIFYGAFDEITAMNELKFTNGNILALAEFNVTQPLTVIDLSGNLQVRSIFDEDYEFHQDEFIIPFIRHFEESISIPVVLEDAELEYLPTQMFTEFLRYHPKHHFDGILYKSSLNPGGVNIVLFKAADVSTEDTNDPTAWLLYRGYELIKINKH